MNILKDLVNNKKQLFLTILLVVYILINIKTPDVLSELIDNVYGNLVLVVLAMILFAHSNIVVGVLGVVATYLLLRRSSVSTGTYAIQHYLPSEKSRTDDFSKLNEVPYSLEEQIISKMAPIVSHSASFMETDVSPVLETPNNVTNL